jgi:ribosomal protein S18 acetylase RimI-like enzyme
MEQLTIRPMEPSDLPFAAACTAAEGWDGETELELTGHYTYDPEGCFVAWVGDARVGICFATAYPRSGFVGELIVVEAMRGRGIGRRLLRRAIGYLAGRGLERIFLDGVPAAVPFYQSEGFAVVCRSLRFSGQISGSPHPAVRPMGQGDLPAVCDLDQSAFRDDRGYFLQGRLERYPGLCLVLEGEGGIAGFIMGLRGRATLSAGPCIVQDGPEAARSLLQALAAACPSQTTVRAGVLETNSAAAGLMGSLGLEGAPVSSWRMCRGAPWEAWPSAFEFAIGSPAKG